AGEYSVCRVTAAVIAAGFAQAQLSSAWIRKPILAAFSALATMVGVIGWILHCEMLKIPQWTSVWPFVVLCLVLTFVTRQQWMDRQSSVRLIVIRIMSLAVFCLCALSATMTWRALEIPDMGSTAAAGLSSHDAAAAAIGRLGPQQLYEHYGYYDGCDSTPWAKAWDRFQASGSKVGGADEVKDPVTGHLVLPWEVARREAVSALDEILAGDLTTQRLPPKFRVPWTSHDLSGIATRILTSEALLRSEEELPKQAAERLIQAVRLDRYFREEATGWSTWLAAVSQELSVLDVFQRLVSDERLTEEDLSDLQEQLTAVIAFPTPGMNVAANREVVWEQLLLRDGYLWGEYQREQRSGFSSERLFEFPAHIMANRSWPERYRSLRLLRLINHRLGNGYRDDSSASVSQAQDWFETSVEQDTDIYVYDPVLTGGLNSPVEQQFRTCFLAERAAVVAVALQRYRRQNGMFPASLTELGEVGIPGDSGFIRDVDGENLLGYAPGGLGFPIPFVDDYRYGYLLHPQQPVLWTPGLSSPIAFRRDLIPSPPLPPLCQMAEPQPNRVCFISGGTRFGVQPGFDEMIHKAREFAELVSKAGGSEMLQQGNAPESLAGRPGWKHLPKLTVPDVDKSSADH
ncbi:MAG: hypothetical protein KDA89_22840, partial [Planctomycetaceae bacterium]|nr:hypothetical protein [Planctomycetaceae bacterium]